MSTLKSNLPLSLFQVNVDDTIEMLPKSRRALTIQEIAALARSSLHGMHHTLTLTYIQEDKGNMNKNYTT